MLAVPKLVADEMLGKLARLLRAMGLDVVYKMPFPDEELLEIAASENRVILTRDTRLIKRLQPEEYIFIEDDMPFHQAAQVIRKFAINALENAFTRCLICNIELQPVSKEDVEGAVPRYVFKTQTNFTTCTGCGKIYWPGTHRTRMENVLKSLMENNGDETEGL